MMLKLIIKVIIIIIVAASEKFNDLSDSFFARSFFLIFCFAYFEHTYRRSCVVIFVLWFLFCAITFFVLLACSVRFTLQRTFILWLVLILPTDASSSSSFSFFVRRSCLRLTSFRMYEAEQKRVKLYASRGMRT